MFHRGILANNSCPGKGGAVKLVGASSSLALANVTFRDNSAYFGGGLSTDSGAITAHGCAFAGNAAEYGGAVHVGSGATLSVSDSAFSNNSCSNFGGALLVDLATLRMARCAIVGNRAQLGGAGYVNKDSAVSLEQCACDGNAASANGGAWLVALDSSRVDASGGSLSGNAAGADGGAVWSAGTFSARLGATLRGNSAGRSGARSPQQAASWPAPCPRFPQNAPLTRAAHAPQAAPCSRPRAAWSICPPWCSTPTGQAPAGEAPFPRPRPTRSSPPRTLSSPPTRRLAAAEAGLCSPVLPPPRPRRHHPRALLPL